MTLEQLRAYANQRHIAIVRPQTQDTLIGLIRRYQPKKVLEIGTATGYSTLLFLLNCGCKINTVDISEEAQSNAKQMIAQFGDFSDRVNFFCGDSAEVIPYCLGSYDFIFLDGAKSQYKLLLPYLIDILSVGGVLVADNVLYMGLTRQADALPNNHKHKTIAKNLAAFLAAVEGDDRLTSTLIEVEEGLSVSVKNKE